MTNSFGPFQIGHHTHQGPRDTNQDTVLSILLPDDRWLVAVADGMGGLEEGELASKTALGALYKSLLAGADLSEAVHEANAAVDREADGRTMGTTLVAALVSGRQTEIVNVGDSRAFQSDLLGLIQVSQDHTMAYEASRDGTIPIEGTEDQSGLWGGALARYLGAGEKVEVDRFGPFDLLEGGWLLLCSDGLHGVMSIDEIDAFLVGQVDAQEAAVALVEEALKRKTGDNVSVALIHWPDSSSAPSPQSQNVRRRTPLGREKVLFSPKRKKPPRKVLGLALKVFLIVIPLIVALVFFLDWVLSI